jgi:hypothetical protein
LGEEIIRPFYAVACGQDLQAVGRGELFHLLADKALQSTDGIARLFVVIALQLGQEALPSGHQGCLPGRALTRAIRDKGYKRLGIGPRQVSEPITL